MTQQTLAEKIAALPPVDEEPGGLVFLFLSEYLINNQIEIYKRT